MTLRTDVQKFLDVTGMSKRRFADVACVNVAQFNMFINHNADLTADNIKRIEVALNSEKQKLREYLSK